MSCKNNNCVLVLFYHLMLHKCFQSFDHNNDNSHNNNNKNNNNRNSNNKKRIVQYFMRPVDVSKYFLLLHELTNNYSKSKIYL